MNQWNQNSTRPFRGVVQIRTDSSKLVHEYDGLFWLHPAVPDCVMFASPEDNDPAQVVGRFSKIVAATGEHTP